MTAPVSQVLSEAADLLVERGWTQGKWERDGCFCLDGALMHVKGSDQTWAELGFVRDAFGGGMGAISWNDQPGRTQGEVITALRRAAALAKEQGR